jgi:glycosyltransferase involved in cell wall biosynthesis
MLVLPSLEMGGAERVMLNLARGIAAAGETITLVVFDASGPLRDDIERDGAGAPAITLVDLGRARARSAVPRLVREIRSRRPSIVISSHTHVNALLVAVRPLLGDVRLVAREPGMWIDGPDESPLVRGVRRTTHRRSDLVLASSRAMQEQLRTILGRPVEVLPNPVDVDGIRVRGLGPERSAGPGRRIICVSRLAPGKGVEDLVRTFAAAAAAEDRLTVVGDGPLRASVERTVIEVGAADRVVLAGALADPVPLLAGSDALVLPSRSEGMPNVALEALAVGTPVIATTDLTTLDDLVARSPVGAVRLVPRSELGPTLAAVPVLGPGPRPTLLPEEHRTEAVVRRLNALLEKERGPLSEPTTSGLRILMPTLAPYPSALASTVQSANMAQAFAELGHEVLLVAANHDPGLTNIVGSTDPAALYGFAPAFRTRTLSERSRRGQSYVNALRIARIARRWRPDLMLSRDLRGCLLPAGRGVPTMYEVHSLTSIEGRQERWVMERLLRMPAFLGFIAISAALADDLAATFAIPLDRIAVAHDGVRLMSGHPSEPRAAGDGTVRVGYTGSLFAGRGIELLAAVAARAPWVELHLVGGPADAAQALEERLAAARSGRIVVHGMVTPARARELQRDMDVLVAPFARQVITDSGVDTSRWMSPMKVFEYMGSGRPIVISDLPVLREVLQPEVDALMVPPEDPDALLAALERLRDDPALRERLAASALERARSEFTWEGRARHVLERYVSARSTARAG